ncbi:CD209 antigen-like protein C [Ambystoma mexicanum]|uniref:CD209 antigen-like protein C n=1 Tax=Ambystoma mexicanum TaxID=8296 RepID=UPI0037E978B6
MSGESPYQELEFQDRNVYSVLHKPEVNRPTASLDTNHSNEMKALERKLRVWKVLALIVTLFAILIILLGVTLWLTQRNMKQDALAQEEQRFLKLQENVCDYTGKRCKYCRGNWVYHAGNCYFYHVVPMNWTDSRAQCRQMEAQLVVVEDAEEQRFLAERVQGLTWIGLSTNELGVPLWEDGTMLVNETAFWQSGQPDNKFGNENCVETNKLGWNDSACRRERFSVCKQTAVIL